VPDVLLQGADALDEWRPFCPPAGPAGGADRACSHGARLRGGAYSARRLRTCFICSKAGSVRQSKDLANNGTSKPTELLLLDQVSAGRGRAMAPKAMLGSGTVRREV
jgi:hypothetical protein